MSHPASRLARTSSIVFLGCALLVLAVTVLVAGPSETQADEKAATSIVYLFVTGEGPSAKAWFKDAPSTGLPVQDALDRFAKQGYRAKLMTDELRSTSDAVAFALLLERPR